MVHPKPILGWLLTGRDPRFCDSDYLHAERKERQQQETQQQAQQLGVFDRCSRRSRKPEEPLMADSLAAAVA